MPAPQLPHEPPQPSLPLQYWPSQLGTQPAMNLALSVYGPNCVSSKPSTTR